MVVGWSTTGCSASRPPWIAWNSLHPGIQAATLVGQSGSPGTFCSLCHEPDHRADHCAMAYLQQPDSQHQAFTIPSPRNSQDAGVQMHSQISAVLGIRAPASTRIHARSAISVLHATSAIWHGIATRTPGDSEFKEFRPQPHPALPTQPRERPGQSRR